MRLATLELTKALHFALCSLTCTCTHNNTNLQMAKITQYVQHSHFSNTKKDKDMDALQWTARAGCNFFCQGKHFMKHAINMNVPTCKWQRSTSRCHNSTAQIERKVEPLRHWHGLLWLWWLKR